LQESPESLRIRALKKGSDQFPDLHRFDGFFAEIDLTLFS